MPPITRMLIAANVAVFVLQGLLGDRLIVSYGLWPLGAGLALRHGGVAHFEPWQLVTSAFLHGSVVHLFVNMFALYIFGPGVERVLGSRRYLTLYTTAVVTASATQLAVVSATFTGRPYPTIGASGGVFGILLAFAMCFPRRIVVLLFPPIPMPAWLFVSLYAVLELANGVLGTEAGVAHFAHLGGMLGAYVLLRRWRRGPRSRASRFLRADGS
jgi:membrane associated rhomboid family serine protease